MNKTPAQTVEFVTALRAIEPDLRHADAVICPPFTALAAAQSALRDSPIGLGAQNMHWANSGAYTGEVSPPHAGGLRRPLGHSRSLRAALIFR